MQVCLRGKSQCRANPRRGGADQLPTTSATWTPPAMCMQTVGSVRAMADFMIPPGARVRRWRLVAYRAWLSASTVTQLTKN